MLFVCSLLICGIGNGHAFGDKVLDSGCRCPLVVVLVRFFGL